MTRAQFASELAGIENGASRNQVKAVLGPADRVWAAEGRGTSEIWYYGVEKENDFASLGQVHFDADGEVVVSYGGDGTPIPSYRIDEVTIRTCLNLIDSMPEADARKWNPSRVALIANVLSEKGKDQVLEIFREYLRVSPPSFESHEKVCLLLRILHEVPAETGCFPELKLGLAVHGQPKDPKLLPRFPVHFLDGIPILMVNGYDYVGDIPTDTSGILNWYSINGVWRKTHIVISVLSEEEITKLKNKTMGLVEQYLDVPQAELTVKTVFEQLDKTRVMQLNAPEGQRRTDKNKRTKTGTERKQGQNEKGRTRTTNKSTNKSTRTREHANRTREQKGTQLNN